MFYAIEENTGDRIIEIQSWSAVNSTYKEFDVIDQRADSVNFTVFCNVRDTVTKEVIGLPSIKVF